MRWYFGVSCPFFFFFSSPPSGVSLFFFFYFFSGDAAALVCPPLPLVKSARLRLVRCSFALPSGSVLGLALFCSVCFARPGYVGVRFMTAGWGFWAVSLVLDQLVLDGLVVVVGTNAAE